MTVPTTIFVPNWDLSVVNDISHPGVVDKSSHPHWTSGMVDGTTLLCIVKIIVVDLSIHSFINTPGLFDFLYPINLSPFSILVLAKAVKSAEVLTLHLSLVKIW